MTCQYTFGLQYIRKKITIFFYPNHQLSLGSFFETAIREKRCIYDTWRIVRVIKLSSKDGFRRIDDKRICDGYLHILLRLSMCVIHNTYIYILYT